MAVNLKCENETIDLIFFLSKHTHKNMSLTFESI